ncbi:MAG: polyprenyl synthetase family protein [Flavobacterium psychrophilum]
MHAIAQYQEFITQYASKQVVVKEPLGLYQPVSYIMGLGGKRLRPVLTLLATELFDANYQEALPAALAVEVFHNFSLVHDDIMDDAPLRRGHETVHEKWDINTGILSGDAMLIMAYRYFEHYEPAVFYALVKLFSQTALEVCEGQQWDIDFEQRDNVTLPEYLKMIEYKTAVLVAAALKMGAIIAKTSEQNAQLLYNFGLYLGIAFQLQDDYLDAFGDPATFGKQVGGDIIENKKTYLYLKAMEYAEPNDKIQLTQLFSIHPSDNSDKIESVKRLFMQTGASQATQEAIESYTQKALRLVDELPVDQTKKDVLTAFAQNLMHRKV